MTTRILFSFISNNIIIMFLFVSMLINRELSEGDESIVLVIDNKEHLERMQQLENTENDIQLKYVLYNHFLVLNYVQ